MNGDEKRILLKWPEDWNDTACHDPEDDGERGTHFKEVTKFITTGTVNEGVGLVSDWGGKAGG